MSLIKDLVEAPATVSTASRFTTLNGLIYMAAGGLLLVWPQAVQSILGDPQFEGHEEVLIRILGMTVVIIGWFYYFGGRSGATQLVAASVLDRIILVPLVLVPVALSGVFTHTFLMFGVLDPALAFIAWYLLSRE
jgi:hypothetical protein